LFQTVSKSGVNFALREKSTHTHTHTHRRAYARTLPLPHTQSNFFINNFLINNDFRLKSFLNVDQTHDLDIYKIKVIKADFFVQNNYLHFYFYSVYFNIFGINFLIDGNPFKGIYLTSFRVFLPKFMPIRRGSFSVI